MKLIITSFLLCFSLVISSQNTIENNTIDNQFKALYKASSNYQKYKVISKTSFLELQQNVLDSLKNKRNTITKKENLLKAEIAKIKTLNTNLIAKDNALKEALLKENNIGFFGLQISKTTYSAIVWLIILALVLLLAFFIFKFYNNINITKTATSNLTDVEKEFELFRKKSLEREQKLRRQLQDEINKQR